MSFKKLEIRAGKTISIYVSISVLFYILFLYFQFDLVCENGYKASLANSMLFFGWALGALVLGVLADKYGRRSVLFPSVFFVIVITFAMSFSQAFWQVAVSRFVIGFFLAGCFLSMYVLATELVGPEKRALAYCGVQTEHAFGLI